MSYEQTYCFNMDKVEYNRLKKNGYNKEFKKGGFIRYYGLPVMGGDAYDQVDGYELRFSTKWIDSFKESRPIVRRLFQLAKANRIGMYVYGEDGECRESNKRYKQNQSEMYGIVCEED